MHYQWKEDQPIYRQLRDQVYGLILDGTYVEGTSLPSVRQVSSDLSINHLTVSKAYQTLVDEGLLEKRRGLGMFVVSGAKMRILEQEKQKFLSVELPDFLAKTTKLGIATNDVIHLIRQAGEEYEP